MLPHAEGTGRTQFTPAGITHLERGGLRTGGNPRATDKKNAARGRAAFLVRGPRAADYASRSFQQYHFMRGMWKGPFHMLPLSSVVGLPARSR